MGTGALYLAIAWGSFEKTEEAKKASDLDELMGTIGDASEESDDISARNLDMLAFS